jgi:hypothetical protein
MARKNRLTIDFDGFDILQKQLIEMGGDAKQAAEKALIESHKIVTQKVTAAMVKHRESGGTADAIIKAPSVEWTGDTASVDVGFDITGGGLASIFLMYGTQLHGQPHITPDRNLYNAVYGSQTRKEILAVQESEYRKMIERVMNG